jgi:hypothetical protein
MWLLERRLVAEAEEAADARALATIEPESYAQTLLSCARQAAMPRLPVTAIADKSLSRRIKAILARRLRVGAPDPRLVRAAMALCALVAAPIAALKPVVATVYTPAAAQAPMPPVPARRDMAMAPPAPPAAPEVDGEGDAAPEAPAAPSAPVAPTPPVEIAALAPPAPPAPPRAPRPPRDDWTPVDGRQIAESVNRAVRESLAASQEGMRAAARASAEVRRELTPERMAQIRRIGEEARNDALRGLAQGAIGMEEGARGMEQGAREMDETAEKLRSPQYRAEQIARAAREGRTVTDAELIAAIPKLHRGADKLRQGAVRMRSEGERMRRGG